MNLKLDNWKKTVPVAILIILVSFLLSNFLSSGKKQKKANVKKSVKQIEKIEVKNIENKINITATGRVNVYNKIDLYAEVSGVLEKGTKEFRIGTEFLKNHIILKINNNVAKMNLNAAKGNFVKLIATVVPDIKLDFPESGKFWEKYLLDFRIEEELKPLPEIKNPKERFYLAGNNIYNQYYSIKSKEETLKKYLLKAPFNGVLSETNLKEGTLVRAGQKIGEFINTDKYEIELSILYSNLKFLKVNQNVDIQIEETGQVVKGKVARINKKIDRSMQTVKVFITSTNKNLKDGMFVPVIIKTGKLSEGVKISRKLLTKENNVFVIENKILKLRPVNLIKIEGEKAIVAGLKNGTVLLGENIPNAFEGMTIN